MPRPVSSFWEWNFKAMCEGRRSRYGGGYIVSVGLGVRAWILSLVLPQVLSDLRYLWILGCVLSPPLNKGVGQDDVQNLLQLLDCSVVCIVLKGYRWHHNCPRARVHSSHHWLSFPPSSSWNLGLRDCTFRQIHIYSLSKHCTKQTGISLLSALSCFKSLRGTGYL